MRGLGALWQCFHAESICEWFRDAGLIEIRSEEYPPVDDGREVPGTFIASAVRPDRAAR